MKTSTNRSKDSFFDLSLLKLLFPHIVFTIVFFFNLSRPYSQSWEYYDSIRAVFIEKRQLDSALIYAGKALEYANLNLKENDTVYADMLNNIAVIYFNTGNYTEAIKYTEQECSAKFFQFDTDPENYINCLNRLAVLYRRTGKNENSKQTYEKAIEKVKMSIGQEHSIYGNLLNNYAQLHFSMGNYNDAQIVFLEALDNIKNRLGKDAPLYGTILNNLGGIYTISGNYDKALPMYLEALEITGKTMGKTHSTYAIRLNSLAQLYLRLGQHERALPLFKEALKITENNLGKENVTYSVNLNNLASLYRLMGKLDEALELFMEVIEISEKVYGNKHPEFANRLNNLAGTYRLLGRFEEAIELYKVALENAELNFGKKHQIYSIRLNNLASIYFDIGEPEKAIPLYVEALNVYEIAIGKFHPNYGINMINLASVYDHLEQYDKAYPYYMEAYENNLHSLEKAFSFLSESEKESFVNTVSSNFSTLQSFFLRYYEENPGVGADAYNIELATKGMILQSGIEMRQAVLNSGDTVALGVYDKWVEIRTELSRQYSLPIADRKENLTEMEQKAERLEGELTRLSNAFEIINSLTNNRWQDVQVKLQENEASVEFASFHYIRDKIKTDSILYVAFLLKHDSEYPIIIPLFEQRQLEEILSQSGQNSLDIINSIYGQRNYRPYNAIKLYELIWQPLEAYLEDVSSIYYSLSGLLHKVSFSAISNSNYEYMCDKFKLNLVSSTSQIPEQYNEGLVLTDALLFGGVNYNGPATLNEVWSYLPGTLIEIESISGMFEHSGIYHKNFFGDYATEEIFKKLSSNSKLLHIATHGFFYPDPNTILADEPAVVIPGEVEFRGGTGFGFESFQNNPNPLMRSGLVFAGANDVWATSEIAGKEDGMLTAYEVSNLNLQNTKLVVLSACETGLGDIRGSEGVYGLQRAFKMAGVKNIIMSLWQVPDKETVEFMEIFYANLIEHKNVTEAFNITQRKMRSKYDPFFWAAFVLIE